MQRKAESSHTADPWHRANALQDRGEDAAPQAEGRCIPCPPHCSGTPVGLAYSLNYHITPSRGTLPLVVTKQQQTGANRILLILPSQPAFNLCPEGTAEARYAGQSP